MLRMSWTDVDDEEEPRRVLESLMKFVANNSQILGWDVGVPESFPIHLTTVKNNVTSIVDKNVSNESIQVFYTVNLAIICSTICLFGIFANIINITIFIRLGFQETMNITLCALAVSDLASLVTLLWMGICVNPFFQYADTPLLTVEVQDITGGWLNVLFLRISGWLTAFVTVERCFCVIFPLKVKRILTPPRVKAIIVFIFLLVTAGYAPIFYSRNLGWKFVPERNRTMLGLVYRDNWAELSQVSILITGAVSTVSFSTLIVISTVILVIALNRKTKWRQQTGAVSKRGQETITTRDRKVVRMVVTIAIIFIICLLFPSLISVPMAVDPEFSRMGRYGSVVMVVITFIMIMGAINSSVNIFVYYNMSSNYRVIFRAILLREHKTS